MLLPCHFFNLNLNHAQPVNFPFLKLKRSLFPVVFGKNSKPFHLFIIIFNKLRLSVPYNTSVADIVFANIPGCYNFSLGIGFKGDSGIPVKYVDLLTFAGTVEINFVIFVSKAIGIIYGVSESERASRRNCAFERIASICCWF
jgi:hypothetical protein